MRRTRSRRASGSATPQMTLPPIGGQFMPLDNSKLVHITDTAFDILEKIGVSGAPEDIRTLALENGATERADGRITFSRTLVEDIIAGACKRVELPGFNRDRGIEVGGGRVHIGTGGAAVQVLDAATNTFRDSTLQDLYSLMRIVDACDSIHYSLRPVVARDLEDPLTLDINTAFAAMKATSKPIGTSFFEPASVTPVVEMFDAALGANGAFKAQPFCFASVCHVVPPLTLAEEACGVMRECVRLGIPLQICSAAQAGATSPAALAGALAQGLAESLAGLVLVNMMQPGFPCILAFLPFISDLRTGAMTGGSGEAAVANAAAAQLLLNLGLPSTVSAGMTDAKTADAQSGYEKGYTIALAAQGGADMINLSVGMLGSIMAASKEALVIDNDMCGAILRSVRGVEMFEGSIDLDMIEQVVTGEGHFLGTAQTLDLMTKEYVYPSLGDRQSVNDWLESGAQTVWDKAIARVAEIEAQPAPSHLPADIEAALRARLPIHLKD
ncbi:MULTISPECIES: trimethylamine methyltransferase family protein [unclassified Ruegeria]|uniref:trimethylamine methyltransferase family protein n=1 Tax=unclassified Ruegeria TaxID=2625375 RepID=UPI001488E351|nr:MULTISPECIES: trimethylamine methyltransferase family protein [unclassified Ruegeria]NOD77815.1 methyltransferase [Ruegeria sp. HKCCD4332]NOD88046.1 methyltransferase [Ruegeria sp. HKCCD4318]NOE14894.1 methyltransferase [Ruegeria sp. HKCCD4318-2]NOG11503.1 methyltransferase [Ruegeria sp. HKCCD4315]